MKLLSKREERRKVKTTPDFAVFIEFKQKK